MKRITSILLLLVAVFVLVSCGETKEKEPAVEFTTDGGINCKVYEGCTPSEFTPVVQAIKAKIPGADYDKVDVRKCIIEKYDDGMLSISFSHVIVNGYEYGGQCYYEMKNDKDFAVHYLKVGPDEYINDGIDLDYKYYYGGSEE